MSSNDMKIEHNEKTTSFSSLLNVVANGAILCLLIVGCLIVISNVYVIVEMKPHQWWNSTNSSGGLIALGESVVSGAICVAIGLFFVKLDFFLSTFSLIKILQSSRPNPPDGGDDAS
ncbi:membrane protein, putative [Nitratidesulfovibrio vulgaris str. Hildenborough]|uniref:Membrane protein, putative n=2 Tax=Nitratidesulfovibrio vulgaris TaxID=881 RepID=Q727X9_NITV2|nr:membrane protein, putative [Nitratidesulfovibrio vulgaris str. Hildenborough]